MYAYGNFNPPHDCLYETANAVLKGTLGKSWYQHIRCCPPHNRRTSREIAMLGDVRQIADICVKALRCGHKIMFCGNGGSAADSQHLAAELVGKLNFDRPPLAALALTTDTSALTAIGNDYGFENVFSRQIEALGKSGDVLIAISTSGNSANILKAIDTANKYNITTIGKTGKSGGEMIDKCDYLFRAQSGVTQEIQEIHMKAGHAYCGLIEKIMFGK